MSRVVVVPGVLALRAEYASLVDPVAELRAAVEAARAWAGEAGRVVTLNGSARRTEASPGPYDARAVPFDALLLGALTRADAATLRTLDPLLAKELWACVEEATVLADALEGRRWEIAVDYDDAPCGVAWWVVRYEEMR